MTGTGGDGVAGQHPAQPEPAAQPVPLVNLAAQHAAVAEEVAAGWAQVLARTAFIGGPQVAAFETEYAEFIGTGYCVGVANGTDAIEIALRGLGVGAGDECILPANTFIATAEAVCRAGATPVLVDVADDGTYLMDPAAVAAAVTPRTRAIIPVHLYGQVAPVEQLMPLAEQFGGWVVEDAAQSQGARRHGTGAGALGHVAATSFYPGKNLGAYGDAGAALTASAELAIQMRMIRDHGSPRKYEHDVLGLNTAWTPSRRSCCPRSCAAGRLERGPAGRCAALRHAAGRDRRDRAAADPARQRARMAPVRGPGPRPGPGPERTSCRRDRRGHPLPCACAPHRGVRRARVSGRQLSSD